MKKSKLEKHLLTFLVTGWMFLPISISAQTSGTQMVTPGASFEWKSISVPSKYETFKNQTPNDLLPAGYNPVTILSFSRQNVPVYVIRDEAEWEAFNKTRMPPEPPVNFESGMIIVAEYVICRDQVSFLYSWQNSIQVTVAVEDYQIPHQCFNEMVSRVAISVPTSKLPISCKVFLRK
jgi:hypothetical protein